jgi:hypothetical protein
MYIINSVSQPPDKPSQLNTAHPAQLEASLLHSSGLRAPSCQLQVQPFKLQVPVARLARPQGSVEAAMPQAGAVVAPFHQWST